MSKVERKELVTQMRIVSILSTGTNGPKLWQFFRFRNLLL